MKISIIIPIYNAAAFLEKSVHSALIQKEVEEVILVEDGSTDDSLKIALILQKKDQKIHLYQHPDKGNHGPGASRNLGVKNAKYPFIAFLDADDFYLPNRFLKTRAVFGKNHDCDGVYEAIGVHFYNEKSKQFYEQLSPYELTTVRQENLTPGQLPFYLIGKSGHQISLDGLTIKKDIVKEIGDFDINLKQAQDTDFIWRLCLNARLYPGQIDKAVSMRGVHGQNSTFNREKTYYYRLVFAEKWFDKLKYKRWDKQINWAIFRVYLEVKTQQQKMNSMAIKRAYKLLIVVVSLLKQPSLLFKFLT